MAKKKTTGKKTAKKKLISPPKEYQWLPDEYWVPYDLSRPEMKKVFNAERKQFPIAIANPLARTIVGWGAHTMTGDEAKAAGIKHALLVTTGLKTTGIVDEIDSILNQAGVATTVFDKVTTNPKDYECYAGLAALKEAGCDGVVSVGGGSSHDCGKAIRLLATLDRMGDKRKIRDFMLNLNPYYTERAATFPDISGIPQVCVNTTTGTGAQIVNGGPINDTELQYKMITIYPGKIHASIDDPLLHRTQPPHILAAAGLDSAIHAIEGLTGRLAGPLAWAPGLYGIKMIAENLREAVGNPQNDVALENCVWAMLLCTHSYLNVGGIGLIHALAHMFGAMGDGLAHHGYTNAIFMVPVCRFNVLANPTAFKDIGIAMGMDHLRPMTPIRGAELAIEELEKFRNELGITNISLNQFDWFAEDPEAHIEHAAEWAYEDFCREANPRQTSREDLRDIMRSMIF